MTTSAQGTSLTQSSVLGTKPSPISRSLSASQNSFTSWPSFTTCQAMSAIRPSSETNRNFFLSKTTPCVNAMSAGSDDSHTSGGALEIGGDPVPDQSSDEIAGDGSLRP